MRRILRHKTSRLRLLYNQEKERINRRCKCRRWRVCEDRIGRLEDSAGINATRRAICYRNHHLGRPDSDMDDLRDSFSSLKKSIKRRIKGKKGKADNPGAGGSVERIGPSGPLPNQGLLS